MEFRNTLEALHAHTEEVCDLIGRLRKVEKVRAIELDLMLDKLRDIYDLTLSLKASISSVEINKVIEQPLNQNAETDRNIGITSTESPVTMLTQPIKEIEEEQIVIKKEEPAKPNMEPKPSVMQPPKQVVEKAEPKHVEDKKAFLSDQFKAQALRYEEITERIPAADISTKITAKPLQSITDGLGLNEKFEFINELFKGNKEKFEATIHVLNSSANFEEAANYMNNTLGWSMKDPYVQRITELVQRKFMGRPL